MSSFILEPSCKICGAENPEPAHFWKTHKIKQETYYKQHYNKRDLLDNSPIEWKGSPETYLLSDFQNKQNMRQYLEGLSPDAAKEYCKNLLLKRKQLKTLKFSLSAVELKSILAPPQQFLEKIFKDEGGYYKVCETLGFINKFIDFKEPPNMDIQNSCILIDSREQKLIKFENIEIATLPYGDYKLKEGNLVIERKSGSDFIGSMVGGYERICREFERAEQDGAYIIVICEEKIQNMLNFKNLPWFSKKIKTSSEFLFHNVRDCCQHFKNLQFVFADGRKETARLIKKLLFNPEIRKYDCQLLMERGLL